MKITVFFLLRINKINIYLQNNYKFKQMKKQILFLGIILFGLFGIVSCETEGDFPVAKALKLSKKELTLKKGTNGEVEILMGNGKYTVESVDETVAKASVTEQGEKGTITIESLKVGETTISVADDRGAKSKIKVTVIHADISLAITDIELTEGTSKEISIQEGSGNYEVVLANGEDKVTAEIKDGKIVITGKKIGKTTFKVKDKTTLKTIDVKVTVTEAPEIAFDKVAVDLNGNPTTKGELTFIVGDKEENRTITVVKGTAPYTVKDKNKGKYNQAKSTFEVKDNKIIFTGNEFAIDEFIVTDAVGKINEIEINVRKQLEIKVKGADADKIEIIVGQTINKKEEIRVEGFTPRITIKENSKSDVVEAKIEDSQNKASRAVILKGLKAGESVLTITDGVVEKTVTVTVKEPEAMKVYKEDATTELNGNEAYDLGKFVIKGGTGNFEVTTDSKLVVTPIEKPAKDYKGNIKFELVRNTQVAQGGVATITVKNLDKAGEEFTFKVDCPTLLEATFKVKDNALPKVDTGEDRRYTIVTGMYAGYNLYNIVVDDVIEVTVVNGSGSYKVEAGASDAIEITENGDNKTFTITAKKKATYYGDIVITDKNDSKKVIKITRIYITKEIPKLTFDKEEVKFILGDTEANRTLTITSGTPPYLIIQKDVSNYSDPKSRVDNITLDKTEEVENYGTKYQCKAGSFTGNTIIFNSDVVCGGYPAEEYIIRDANGKEKIIEINVVKQLEVNKTTIDVLVGQTVEKVKLEGYAEKFKIKSNSDNTVVEASIEGGNNKASRALILKGLKVGASDVIVTDGLVEKTVKVTVSEPKPMELYKEDASTKLDETTEYELGKFVIKGATGNFEVTTDSNLVKKIDKPNKSYSGGDYFEFKIERNVQIATGGVVTITVKNLDKPTEVKTFKVKCETLLELSLKVNGNAIQKADSGSGAYYSIAEGMYPGYNIRGVKVNDVIEFTVANGSGDYKVEIDSYGADKVEITENGTNTTFTVTMKKTGTYYGDITITDKADAKKVVKISRIYIE